MGWPAPLPQALQIGYRSDGQAALEWGNLLQQQGEPASAQLVYEAALRLDPFLDEVRSGYSRAAMRRSILMLKNEQPSLP